MPVPALSHHVEEPSAGEVDAFMQEIEEAERARIFRDMVRQGTCGFCMQQTLSVSFRASRMVLMCPCAFRG